MSKKINAAIANFTDGGHLSYVRLSGGFGTTTLGKRTETSTFADARRGSISDIGISYVFQVRSKKSKVTTMGKDAKPDHHTPQVIGLLKCLGGSSSVHFKHADPDQKDNK